VRGGSTTADLLARILACGAGDLAGVRHDAADDGLQHQLHNEGRRTVAALGADGWLVAAGAPGPFTTSTPIRAADADRVAAAPGVARADPLVILHATIRRPAVRDVNVIGTRPGGLGAPPLAEGRAVARPGEVVADTELALRPGDRIELSGRRLQVVGLADQVTWYFGTPTLFLALEDAQAVAFDGQPLAMAILTQGMPAPGCPGWRRCPTGRPWTTWNVRWSAAPSRST
jgi:hypothetical protein